MTVRDLYRLVFAAFALLSLILPARGEALDSQSRTGLHCATVLHGLASASNQDNFEDAGFSQADVPQYQGRADFWYSWVAKRVGQPRGQLEQRSLSDAHFVGDVIASIAAGNDRNRPPGTLFDLLQAIVGFCVEYQDDVARGGNPRIDAFPSGWPPAALMGPKSR